MGKDLCDDDGRFKIQWVCPCGKGHDTELADFPNTDADDGCECGRMITMKNVTEYGEEGPLHGE